MSTLHDTHHIIAKRRILLIYCALFYCLTLPPLYSETNTKAQNSTQDLLHNTTPISLDLQEISIKTILKKLAREAGCNLIIDNKVEGKMSIQVHRMPAHQVLELILKTQGLTQEQIGNTWIISLSQPSSYKKSTLVSKKFSLHHREARDIAQLFSGKPSTTPTSETQLTIDEQSNSLWIQGTSEHIERLEKLIQQFDHPIPQILIEARIVSVDRHFERELGIRFGLSDTSESTRNLLSTAHQIKTNDIKDINGALNIALPEAASGFVLARLGQHYLLDLELSALESAGGGQIISSPHLITANRAEASISTGIEIPYSKKRKPKKSKTTAHKTDQDRTSIHFKKAALTLKVTPNLIENKRILLNIQLTQDQLNKFHHAIPALETRAIKTQVIVAPNETIVLGGIYEQSHNHIIRRIPFLSSLPLFGPIFSHRIQIDRTKELLIFLTPHILVT